MRVGERDVPLKRSPMKKVGPRGRKRAEAWRKAKQEHLSLHPTCEGYGILPLDCSGPLQVHHVIARGSGGGKDYGEYKTLCMAMHQWVEANREEAKGLGFLKSFWSQDD